MKTILEIIDLAPAPKARLDLPLSRVGDRLRLRFLLQRKNKGRTEVLNVQGDYRVSAAVLESNEHGLGQALQIASTGAAPAWRAVKNEIRRRLAPAKNPRTIVT